MSLSQEPNLADLDELDAIIMRSLQQFVAALNDSQWTGQREREAINLYVMGHLLHEIRPNSVLFDATQIAIEVPVQQIAPDVQRTLSGGNSKPKAQVAKDLVIWPRPRMTVWDSDGQLRHSPLAILEWKWGKIEPSEYDLRWLESYSSQRQHFSGYVVSLLKGAESKFALAATRVQLGEREVGWLQHSIHI